MELELRYGDYVCDGAGGLSRKKGKDALLQRVLFRLTARRGQFPFWESLGSQLWKLGSLPTAARQAAAKQFVTEALEEEDVTVESVELNAGKGATATVHVVLLWRGETLEVSLNVQE